MTRSRHPLSPTGGTTPEDLEAVRRILPEAGWHVEEVLDPTADGPWIEATDPERVRWAIGRDTGGCYFAVPDHGFRSVGVRDLATAEEAATGMRNFVIAGLRRFVSVAA
ncbi:hypothetical protein ACQW02_05165 [Humitalea sp. 24SJ18S-53]|uniref:hypothetical protein n=1 Tax=Humitalea sp. 24SJ18S-53 TaxID=3422307 RepID=UPI003D6778E9